MHSTVRALHRLDTALQARNGPWRNSNCPQAAVLVALSAESEPLVLLGRRAAHLHRHAGEVAFPGGKREQTDGTPWCTATREAQEEAGVESDRLYALGLLQPLVTRTGFEVHPCVASVPADMPVRADHCEFDSLFKQPLSRFADKKLFSLEIMEVAGAARKVPYYRIDNDTIWGVTAAVLAMLANIAYDAGLDLQRDWKGVP